MDDISVEMDCTSDYQPTRGDRIYAWVYSVVGALILIQIWILVIAIALALPIAGVIGLIVLLT